MEFVIPELDQNTKSHLGIIIDNEDLIWELLNERNDIRLSDYKLLFYKAKMECSKKKIIDKIVNKEFIGSYQDLEDMEFIQELWGFVRNKNIDYKLKFVEILTIYKLKLDRDFIIDILLEISKEKTLLFSRKVLTERDGKYLFINNTDKITHLTNNRYLRRVLEKYNDSFVEFPIDTLIKNPNGKYNEEDQRILGNLGIFYGTGRIILN